MDYVKITFDNTSNPSIFIGDNKIIHPSGKSTKILFQSFSRIDGLPIYKIDITKLKHPIVEYSVTVNKLQYNIKSVDIINPIPNNMKYYTDQAENEDKIIEFILEQLNMTKKDLEHKDTYKTIIRQLKLNKII